MSKTYLYYITKSTTYPKTHKNVRFFSDFCLTAETRLNYIKNALANASAGRRKLNLQMANNSTPNRAFFVRSVRAPLQNSLSFDRLFPMVARNGQPFAVGCCPFVAVFLPRYVLPPVVGKLAVVPKNLQMDTAEMIYKFLCVNRTHPHFNLCVQTVEATNETHARLRLTADFRHLATIAKINPKNNRTFAQGGVICVMFSTYSN